MLTIVTGKREAYLQKRTLAPPEAFRAGFLKKITLELSLKR